MYRNFQYKVWIIRWRLLLQNQNSFEGTIKKNSGTCKNIKILLNLVCLKTQKYKKKFKMF